MCGPSRPHMDIKVINIDPYPWYLDQRPKILTKYIEFVLFLVSVV